MNPYFFEMLQQWYLLPNYFNPYIYRLMPYFTTTLEIFFGMGSVSLKMQFPKNNVHVVECDSWGGREGLLVSPPWQSSSNWNWFRP